MTESLPENKEMGSKHKKKKSLKTAQNVALAEGFTSELNQPCWSVVTFKSIAVSNLTYKEARRWAKNLKKQGVSGLCVVTDEAASRVVS